MTFSSEHAASLALSHRRRTIGDVGTLQEHLNVDLPHLTAGLDRVRSAWGLAHVARAHRSIMTKVRMMKRVADNQQRTQRESAARQALTHARAGAVDLPQMPESAPLGVPVPHTDPEARPADQHVHSLTHAANAPGVAA